VIVAVAEAVREMVCVISGEGVAVRLGLGAGTVSEGVKRACNVSAAAVWTSSGGGNCSNGILQPMIAKKSTIAARDGNLDFIEFFIDFARSKGLFPRFYHPSIGKIKNSHSGC
jgi:hypothetical protein